MALGESSSFVVACPKDVTMYEDAIKTSGNGGAITLREITELVAEALAPEQPVLIRPARSRQDADDAGPALGDRGELGVAAQLDQDRADVVAHRRLGDPQPPRDDLRRPLLPHQVEHLLLARCERRRLAVAVAVEAAVCGADRRLMHQVDQQRPVGASQHHGRERPPAACPRRRGCRRRSGVPAIH